MVIAGGGIGGLVLANALQRHNIDYVLYEKTREYKPFGGPIQVQSNALAALEAINKDMCERIMAAGTTTGNRVNGLKDGMTNRCVSACVVGGVRVCVCGGLGFTCLMSSTDARSSHPPTCPPTHPWSTHRWYCQFDTGAPAQKRGLPLTRVVDRPDLQSILLDYIDRSKLHNGLEVASFVEGKDGGVEVTLTNGEKVQADVLVRFCGRWVVGVGGSWVSV